MTLGKKTAVIAGTALLGLLLALLLVSSTIVRGGYRQVEVQETRAHVRQVALALEEEARRLDATTADWASSDETYDFVQERDPHFLRSNLSTGTLRGLELDIVAIVNVSGEVVWGQGYDHRRDVLGPLPEGMDRWLAPGSPLLVHPSTASRLQGLVATRNGAMVVAARPILTSHDRGPIRGTLVMGRLLSDDALGRLERVTGLDIVLHPLGAAPADALPDPRGTEIVVRPLDHSIVEGAKILDDVAGDPALVVRVHDRRVIVAEGAISQRYLLIAILVTGVLFALGLVLAVQRLVLRRIRRIGARVAEAAASADPSLQTEVQGADELGALGGGINAMLDTLDRARGQRDEVAERYRAVVEQASEGILLMDPGTTRILEVNHAYRELAGRDAESLLRCALRDLVEDPDGSVPALIERLVAGGPPELLELRHRRGDGPPIDVEVAANLVTHGGRKVISAMVRDISQQRQAREIVRRREAILGSVAFAAERLLQEGEGGLPEVLARLGEAAATSRVYVFEKHRNEDGRLVASRRAGWTAPGVEPQENPLFQAFPLEGVGLDRWVGVLSRGGTVGGPVRDFPGPVQELLSAQDIRSLLIVPIFAGEDLWGVIGFDDCVRDRDWSPSEVGGLRAAAGILGAAIQRGRTERAQAESDARYRGLVEQVPAIVYTAEFGDEGMWRYVSPQIHPMLGFDPDEWMRDPRMWERRIHPADRDRAMTDERRSEATGEPLSSEYRMIARDGTIRWFRDEATVRKDADGQPLLQGVMYEITERREAEEKLRRHNEYLMALHETALALMDRLDLSDLLETVVRRAAALTETEDGWLYLLEPDGRTMEFKLGIGELAEHVGLRIHKGEGVSGKVWETGERVVVDGYGTWSERLPGFSDRLGGAMAVPLKSGGELIGVIGLSHREPGGRFSREDADLLSGFAELASIAVDNARLYQSARTEQERVRTLSDAALEGIVIHEDGKILEVNGAFSTMFGRPSDDLVGRRLEDLMATGSREQLRERLLVPSEEPVELEARPVDGKRFVVEVQTRAMSHGGRPVQMAAVRDVSERKRAEEEVRLLHAITVAMAETEDPDAALEVAVREVCRTTGWELGEAWIPSADGSVLRCSPACYTQAEGLEAFRVHSQALTLDPGQGLPGRVWASREPQWVEDLRGDAGFLLGEKAANAGFRAAAAFPVLAGDEVVAVLSFLLVERRVEDTRVINMVSAVAAQLGSLVRRKRTEEALRVAEEKYRGIFEQAAEGIFRMTSEGRYESVNPALAAMLGYGSQEDLLAEAPDLRAVHVDQRRLEQWRSRLHRRGHLKEFEYEARRRDGSTLWVSENTRAIRDESNRVVAVEGTMLDISQRRRAEESLRKAYESERDVAEQLRAVDEMKNAFLAAVSHELRTPLSSILGFSLTIAREDIDLSPGERKEMVERIAANARKLERLLGDLLDLDRMSRGILEPSRRVTDIGGLVRGVVQEAELRGHPVTVEAETLLADVDAPKVERIVENLLANAVKYTPRGTPVWVRAGADEGGVLLLVEDGGPGVPEDQRLDIFEPFRQGDGTPRHAPGTGVGLSLVSRFAELHGGRAWVEERHGGGASFRVHLPGRVGNGEQDAGGHRSPGAVSGGGRVG